MPTPKPLPSLSIRSISRDLFAAVRMGAALQGESMESFARHALYERVLRLAKGPKGAPLAAIPWVSVQQPSPK